MCTCMTFSRAWHACACQICMRNVMSTAHMISFMRARSFCMCYLCAQFALCTRLPYACAVGYSAHARCLACRKTCLYTLHAFSHGWEPRSTFIYLLMCLSTFTCVAHAPFSSPRLDGFAPIFRFSILGPTYWMQIWISWPNSLWLVQEALEYFSQFSESILDIFIFSVWFPRLSFLTSVVWIHIRWRSNIALSIHPMTESSLRNTW